MNIHHKASTATVIPKLKGTLIDDMEVLQDMLKTRAKGSDSYILIDSLRDAKAHLLNLLPSIGGASEIPTTNQKNNIEGYRLRNSSEVQGRVLLIGLLLEIETKQLAFIKKAYDGIGLPQEIKSTTEDILRIYLTIVDQLGRAKKTQQMGTIVI